MVSALVMGSSALCLISIALSCLSGVLFARR